jgi:microcystin-dependent protein
MPATVLPGYTFIPGDVITAARLNAAASGAVPNATDVALGVIQLTGDLAGLATAPSISLALISAFGRTLTASIDAGAARGILGLGSIATASTINGSMWSGQDLAVVDGGTGMSGYATGDLIFASTPTTLATLAAVPLGNALISGGAGAAPAWGKIDLATHVAGSLPPANGGSGATSLGPSLKNGGGVFDVIQDVRTTASPTFANMTVPGTLTVGTIVSTSIGNPTGTIILFAGAAGPANYELCDGGAISRVTYAALFAIIGIDYGPGDGVNTFNKPDLRGRVPVGLGQSDAPNATNWTRGRKDGDERHQLSQAEMPSHTHGYVRYGNLGGTGGQNPVWANTAAIQSDSAGGDQSHQNLQPSLGLGYFIKT